MSQGNELNTELMVSLLGKVTPVQMPAYQHSFTLEGKPIGRCVDADFSTHPWTLTLELEPGVSKEEIQKMALFAGLNVKFI